MTGSTIAPIPAWYGRVQFRSTLEADWAVTLDYLNLQWQYEPVGVRLPSGALYRPDFYLPQIATWLEVKGPDGEGLDKTRELAEVVAQDWWTPHQCVVVGLAPIRGEITSYLIDGYFGEDADDALFKCADCGTVWWCGSGSYGCRACNRGGDDSRKQRGTLYDRTFIQLKRLRT